MQPQYHTKEINIDFLIPLNIQSLIRIFQLSLNCFILQLLSFLNQDRVRFHPLLLLVLSFSWYGTLSPTTLVNVFISDFLKRLVSRILYFLIWLWWWLQEISIIKVYFSLFNYQVTREVILWHQTGIYHPRTFIHCPTCVWKKKRQLSHHWACTTVTKWSNLESIIGEQLACCGAVNYTASPC